MNEAILVTSDGIGSPDQKLGALLLGNFYRILGDKEQLPKYVVLLNGGVKTAARGSDTVDYLKALEERGVSVVICRTCVEYYGLEEDIALGEVDGMARIIDILSQHNVLTI